MPFDKNFAISVMYPAATAAYQIMTVPNPPLPPGYTLVGSIQANPGAVVSAMEAADPDQQNIVHQVIMESNIFGLVAWNAAAKSAIVAIRGTQTLWDWIADFDAAVVPYAPNPGAGGVHMGFQLVYLLIRDSVKKLLQTGCAGAQQIWVTGHSLGAALALLCAFDLLNPGFGATPQLYTFAGPRTGDPQFVASFDAAIPVCYRIVNFMDVVPQVPLPPFYGHVLQEIDVNGGFRPLNVAYAHSLTTYLAGLQKLP